MTRISHIVEGRKVTMFAEDGHKSEIVTTEEQKFIYKKAELCCHHWDIAAFLRRPGTIGFQTETITDIATYIRSQVRLQHHGYEAEHWSYVAEGVPRPSSFQDAVLTIQPRTSQRYRQR